jgi:GTP-binding protein HflX
VRARAHAQVVLGDTVGFIQRLPPQLVAAFRSTLEHIESASLIAHVVDVSHPLAAAQSEAVLQVPPLPSCPVAGRSPCPATRLWACFHARASLACPAAQHASLRMHVSA